MPPGTISKGTFDMHILLVRDRLVHKSGLADPGPDGRLQVSVIAAFLE